MVSVMGPNYPFLPRQSWLARRAIRDGPCPPQWVAGPPRSPISRSASTHGGCSAVGQQVVDHGPGELGLQSVSGQRRGGPVAGVATLLTALQRHRRRNVDPDQQRHGRPHRLGQLLPGLGVCPLAGERRDEHHREPYPHVLRCQVDQAAIARVAHRAPERRVVEVVAGVGERCDLRDQRIRCGVQVQQARTHPGGDRASEGGLAAARWTGEAPYPGSAATSPTASTGKWVVMWILCETRTVMVAVGNGLGDGEAVQAVERRPARRVETEAEPGRWSAEIVGCPASGSGDDVPQDSRTSSSTGSTVRRRRRSPGVSIRRYNRSTANRPNPAGSWSTTVTAGTRA